MRIAKLTLVLGIAAASAVAGPLAPTNLRVEHLKNPLGIDVTKPRFSWELQHTARGQAQSAYQITVNDADGGPVWDSGRVASPQSSLVEYGGHQLKSGH